MKNAPLSLDVSYPTLIHIVSDPDGARDTGHDVECNAQVWRSQRNERKWRVQLAVKFKPKGSGVAAHRGEITYMGIFTVVEDYPAEKMFRLIGVDAPSILYSSIRELVALLTGRSSTTTVMLPTVSFIDNIVVSPTESVKAKKLPSAPKKVGKRLESLRRKSTRSDDRSRGNV